MAISRVQPMRPALSDVLDAIDALETAGHKRVAVYIGNSYTNGEGSTSGNDGLRALTAQKLFDENYRFTAGGAGFQTYSNHDTTYYNLLQKAAASTQFDNETVTDVIFISAMGDTRALCEGNTLETNINNCSTYVKNNFPNAKMYITYAEMVVGRTTQSRYSPKYWMYQLRCHQVFLNESLNKEFIYLGWIGWNGNNMPGYNAADGYHPNDAGYQLLASMFLNAYAGYSPYRTKSAAKDNVKIYANDPLSGRVYVPSTIQNSMFPDGIVGSTDYKLCDLVDASSIMPVVPLQNQNNIYACLCLDSRGTTHPACVYSKIDTTTGNAELMIRFRETIEQGSVPNMNSNRMLPYQATITAAPNIIFN